MKPIRVLLADDHTLIRAGIRSLLQGLHDMEVAGEAGDGQEALRLAEALRPDVVLLDIGMPGLNGLDVTARMTKLESPRHVVILSMNSSEEYVRRVVSQPRRLQARGRRVRQPDRRRRRRPGHAGAAAAGHPAARGRGHSSKAIARQLGVSYRTVQTHRNEPMKCLDIHDVPGLVRFAVRVGMMTQEG